ncbi:MAG: hypothetical protein KBD06_01150 [Candidatus Pacebacteria bacterium]|nr:hypothetical protein [Candidatus Paceibacterota bacterium]
MIATSEAPSIDRFIDLFLAALVLRGKRAVWVRGNEAQEERRRMHALCDYLDGVVGAEKDTPTNRDYLYFLVRLRNHVAPSNIGSFDNLQHSILSKMSTIVSVDLAYCYFYQIDLQAVTARDWLARADERIRKLVEEAADAYMKPMSRN